MHHDNIMAENYFSALLALCYGNTLATNLYKQVSGDLCDITWMNLMILNDLILIYNVQATAFSIQGNIIPYDSVE